MNNLLILYYIVVYTALFFIAKKDVQSRIIDGKLLFVLIGAWSVRAGVESIPLVEVMVTLGTAGLLYVVLLLIALAYERIRGRYSIGGGDLKLFAVSALLVGPSHVLLLVFVSSLLGIVIYVSHPWEQGLFPFGPAIVVATCLFLMTL